MIKTTQLWVLACDICGGESRVYSSRYKALTEAEKYERWQVSEKRQVCRSCLITESNNEGN